VADYALSCSLDCNLFEIKTPLYGQGVPVTPVVQVHAVQIFVVRTAVQTPVLVKGHFYYESLCYIQTQCKSRKNCRIPLFVHHSYFTLNALYMIWERPQNRSSKDGRQRNNHPNQPYFRDFSPRKCSWLG